MTCTKTAKRKIAAIKALILFYDPKKAARLCVIIFITTTLPINKQDSIKYTEYLSYSIKN